MQGHQNILFLFMWIKDAKHQQAYKSQVHTDVVQYIMQAHTMQKGMQINDGEQLCQDILLMSHTLSNFAFPLLFFMKAQCTTAPRTLRSLGLQFWLSASNTNHSGQVYFEFHSSLNLQYLTQVLYNAPTSKHYCKSRSYFIINFVNQLIF